MCPGYDLMLNPNSDVPKGKSLEKRLPVSQGEVEVARSRHEGFGYFAFNKHVLEKCIVFYQ